MPLPAVLNSFLNPDTTPAWFFENLDSTPESIFYTANNARAHTLCWNRDKANMPALILVHGFSGHAHWWSFLAPFFADRYRIFALDLPGMGDSDSLPDYDDHCFSTAIISLLDELSLDEVRIVGHSFGGVSTMQALARADHRFKQAIIVDSIYRFSDEPPIPVLEPRGAHRLRDTQLECIEQFRLSPDQPLVLEYLRAFVAYHSCHNLKGSWLKGSWQWKFDPRLKNHGEVNNPLFLKRVSTRFDLIYGECSLFSGDNRPQRLMECAANPGDLVMIADAHHHIMMDHPLELTAAINRLLI